MILIRETNLTEWRVNNRDLKWPEGKWLCKNNGNSSLVCSLNTDSLNICLVPVPALGSRETDLPWPSRSSQDTVF